MGAAGAGFGALAAEDAEEVVAALGGGEGEPGSAGLGVAGEESFEDGRGFAFAFHGEKEAFGHLGCAVGAAFR